MFIRISFAIIFLGLIPSICGLSCLEVKKKYEKACLAMENENYIHCVRTRMKRHSSECEYSNECFGCDCDQCSYSQCGGQCEQCCNSCCSNYVQCHTNHCCHKQCHAECRTYDCRSSCRKSCYGTIEKEREHERVITIDRQTSENTQQQINSSSSHNITTIINLKNVLNNTNIVDVPINVTYSNKNNITLSESADYGGGTGSDGCCIVIGPRQCIPSQLYPYTRCFHTRSKQCGSYCSTNIVHEESKQICTSVDSFGKPTNCQQQTSYIPQPQPKCTYTSSWPYVACGIQPTAACEGCYGHYFNTDVKKFKSCPPQCYDDFSVGPLYRQGPFYQPGYSHVAPCMYSGQGCAAGFGGMNGVPMAGGFEGTPLMMGGGFGAMGYGQLPGGYGFNQGFGAPYPYALPFQSNFNQLVYPQFQGNWSAIFNETNFNSTDWSPKINDYQSTFYNYQYPVKEYEVLKQSFKRESERSTTKKPKE